MRIKEQEVPRYEDDYYDRKPKPVEDSEEDSSVSDEPLPEVPEKKSVVVLSARKRPQRPDQWKTYPMWD